MLPLAGAAFSFKPSRGRPPEKLDLAVRADDHLSLYYPPTEVLLLVQIHSPVRRPPPRSPPRLFAGLPDGTTAVDAAVLYATHLKARPGRALGHARPGQAVL